MTIPTVGIDETSPAGSDNANQGDNRIREFKTQNREILEVDHNYQSSGQDADAGKHKKVSLIEQADLGTGATGKPILGAQTVSGKAELVFTDEDDNDVQITSGGKILFTSLSNIPNNTYLKAIDNAGTGTGDLIKLNASDVAVIPDGSQTATSAAPTADADIVNKKYVDESTSGKLDASSALVVTAWVSFVGSSGTIQDSSGVSSVTRNSAGDYTVNFSSTLANANYMVQITTEDGGSITYGSIKSGGRGTTSVSLRTLASSSTPVDPTSCHVMILGG